MLVPSTEIQWINRVDRCLSNMHVPASHLRLVGNVHPHLVGLWWDLRPCIHEFSDELMELPLEQTWEARKQLRSKMTHESRKCWLWVAELIHWKKYFNGVAVNTGPGLGERGGGDSVRYGHHVGYWWTCVSSRKNTRLLWEYPRLGEGKRELEKEQLEREKPVRCRGSGQPTATVNMDNKPRTEWNVWPWRSWVTLK